MCNLKIGNNTCRIDKWCDNKNTILINAICCKLRIWWLLEKTTITIYDKYNCVLYHILIPFYLLKDIYLYALIIHYNNKKKKVYNILSFLFVILLMLLGLYMLECLLRLLLLLLLQVLQKFYLLLKLYVP